MRARRRYKNISNGVAIHGDQRWARLGSRSNSRVFGSKPRVLNFSIGSRLLIPSLETVSQCHSEPQAKNLLFARCRKYRCLARAQHDIQVVCSIATPSLPAEAATQARQITL